MRSSADPAHVVLNMAFTPEEDPWMRLLMAFTCLLRLKDALLVKESSRDLPEPVKKNFRINMKKNHKTFQKSPKYVINQKEMQAASGHLLSSQVKPLLCIRHLASEDDKSKDLIVDKITQM